MSQWEYQIEYFAERKELFQVLIYENRGMSLSDPVSGRWTTRKMARDALYLLDYLGWKDNVHVVGLSMGGMIAQEICKQGGPNRFASLTLLSTISGGLFSLWYFFLCIPSGIQLLARAALARNGRDQLKHALGVLYPDDYLRREIAHPETGEMATNFQMIRKGYIRRALASKAKGMPIHTPLSTVLKQALAVTTHWVTMDDLAQISRNVHGNVLIITGDDDILVHAANSHRLHQGLKAKKYVVLPGAGHGAFEQCSEEVNREIEQLVLNAAAGTTTTRSSNGQTTMNMNGQTTTAGARL